MELWCDILKLIISKIIEKIWFYSYSSEKKKESIAAIIFYLNVLFPLLKLIEIS